MLHAIHSVTTMLLCTDVSERLRGYAPELRSFSGIEDKQRNVLSGAKPRQSDVTSNVAAEEEGVRHIPLRFYGHNHSNSAHFLLLL